MREAGTGSCRERRILYLISHLGSTGPNQQLLNLVKHMPEGEFQPIVLALSASKGADLAPEFRDCGIEVRSPAPGRSGLLEGIRRVKSAVLELKPTVVHSHGIRSDLISALLLRRYTRVSTLRCNPFVEYSGRMGRLAGGILGHIHLAALSSLDTAVACSRALAALVEEKCGFRFHAIQNGVDTRKFRPPAPGGKIEMRVRLGLPLDSKILIFAGALSRQKDPLTIMEAADRMSEAGKIFLVFLGDGPLKGACKEFGKRARFGSMFPGNVRNVREYMAAADYFVSMSLSEGLPNGVLEALATGLPVCLSSIGPHLEILDKVPAAGATAPPGDSDALAAALGSLLAKDCEALSSAARAAADLQFSAMKMSGEYMQVYRKLSNSIDEDL